MNKHTEYISQSRFESLDILRGFDMMWIMGVPAIISALNALFGGPVFEWLSTQMEHATWDGLQIMDMVFPTFLLIAGCSFPFSLAKRRRVGEPQQDIYKHIIKRGLLLVLLGTLYNGALAYGIENIRVASVLGRIGWAWVLAAIIFMNTSKLKTRAIIFFGILLGYNLLIGLVKAPDASYRDSIYSMQGSLVGWVDRMLLPGVLHAKIFDPEGILSTIPAIATALLGMVIGNILLNEDQRSKLEIGKEIFMYGVSSVVLGLTWSLVMPINKSLWTSPFVLICGGIGILFLSLLFWIVDIKGYKGWGYVFKIIGANSLAIYMLQTIVNFSAISHFFLGTFVSLLSEEYANLILSLGYVFICWLLLYFMYKRNIFFKI